MADHEAIRDDLPLAEVSALLERIGGDDGIPPISGGELEAAERGEAEILVLEHEGDQIGAAFTAQLGRRWTTEFTIRGDHRGAGAGGRLLEALRARHAERGIEPWYWSHGDFPAARALADRAGLVRARELLQMRLAAGSTAPVPEAPEGVVIRTFEPGRDEPEWQRVNNAAFSWHPEQGEVSLEDLQRQAGESDFDAEGFFLAVDADDADRVLGFHQTKLGRTAEGLLGEVYVVAVDPAVHARGLGRLLTQIGLAHLAARGAEQIELYVEGDNGPARRLYEKLGFTTAVHHISYGPAAEAG